MAGMPVHRQGDLDTGHGCWPPRPTSSWASRTYVNNLLVHRDGDAYEVHCCPSIPECHAGTGAGGSATVFVENKALRRLVMPCLVEEQRPKDLQTYFVANIKFYKYHYEKQQTTK